MSPPPDRLPSLNALRAFEAASRHLNFRLAGVELGVTQGAVAQQIRALEAELGLKLFERHPRTLALTHNGQRYATGVRRSFDLLAEATRSLRPEPLHATVSVTPTFATKWLIPRLADYTRQHPNVDLRILATERLSHFHTEAVDLAVRYGRPPFGPGLVADLLFEECLVAVASPQLLHRCGPAQTAADRDRYVLLHDSQSAWADYLGRLAPAAAQEPPHAPGQAPADGTAPPALWFNQTTLAIDAALTGQGVALVQKEFVAPDLGAGRLAKVWDEEVPTGAGYYLVSPRKQRAPEVVAGVKAWLLDQVAAGTAAPAHAQRLHRGGATMAP
ncbi:MAG: LysR substrate-binding domain-containing protein [Acidovorax sp.]|uniref:LysR substrate-binding domain-containing protein n=1 Tax=Acidovorax sp. TaxID=1872122 RepID=UPI0025C4FA06|nr:LysR substrate-binding domain-containing protein [Acidovorax sp.]MCE1191989.1 LysR substrate-binding domain-containing protein [Acidovorax sp.]